MKTLPPLMLLCWGAASSWRAKVIKVMHGEKWRRPDPKDGREAEGRTARDAVAKAITLHGKEPRTCRRCGRTWECRRTRDVRICPACQTKRAVRGHNDLTEEQNARVDAFLAGLGPYQSDVWSNSYRSEILEHVERNRKP